MDECRKDIDNDIKVKNYNMNETNHHDKETNHHDKETNHHDKETNHCDKNMDHHKKENKYDIKEISIEESAYPNLLRYIDKPPKILYALGDLDLLNKRCVAVVGARKASYYGKWAAYNIGKRLAQYGIVTVSGMAYGCDAEAHRGAIEGGGKTIAVLGCGIDICYPAAHRKLRKSIIENGLLISEYISGTKPAPYTFPQRNRIISGISEAVCVAEAGISSGSLITASYAGDQGRSLFVVPGNISVVSSLGSNKLIQDGAFPIAVVDDIISALGIMLKPDKAEIKEEMGSDEETIYNIVCHESEVTAEQLAARLRKSIPEINAMVSIMEIKGFLTTSMGKIFIAR